MPFIKSLTINADRQHPFPYNIPAVKFAKQITLNDRVTIFVGDNGSGKSTLLESIALSLNLPLTGGLIGSHAGFEAARLLKPYVQIEWGRQTNKGFFFRAEDFSDFINRIYEIQEDGMQQVGYKETDHYRITKTFLDNPNHYLRHLA